MPRSSESVAALASALAKAQAEHINPEKSLTAVRKRTGGRNNAGRMTMRHRGGGHKRKYRLVDFKRKKQGVVAEVLAIEYDPNRSARIALLQYSDGEKAYILAPVGLAVGAKVNAGETADPSIGNALPLKAIPLGTAIHNVEIIPGRGAQMVRSFPSDSRQPRRRICPDQTRLRRNPQNQRGVLRHHRSGR